MKISEISSKDQINEWVPLAARGAAMAAPYLAKGGRALKNLFKGKADKADDLTTAAQRRVDPTLNNIPVSTAAGKPRVSVDQAQKMGIVKPSTPPAAPSAAPTAAPASSGTPLSAAPKASLGKKASRLVGKAADTTGSALKYAINNPLKTTYKVAAPAVIGKAAIDAASSDEPGYDFATGVTTPFVDFAKGTYDVLAGQKREKPEAAATTDDDIPDFETDNSTKDKEDDIPDFDTKNEGLSYMLKLSGQRSITERDNIVGITKPKKIETLTESVQIDECGGMMPSMDNRQPASLNISATASSGDEVANMLKSIMQLAGVKPVTPDMMPTGEILPKLTSEPALTKPMHGEMQEETYDNTPEERVEPYDPNNMAHVINKISSKDMATTPYQSASNPLSEEPKKEEKVDEDVYHGLFKAYQEFKNSQ
jgi:hypothetical protein